MNCFFAIINSCKILNVNLHFPVNFFKFIYPQTHANCALRVLLRVDKVQYHPKALTKL